MADVRSRKRPHSSDRVVAASSSLETATIPVKWVIPSFKKLLTRRSEPFHHESLPGISWQFYFRSHAGPPPRVRLYLRTIMNSHKSDATAVTASFSVQLARSDGIGSPIKQVLPAFIFRKDHLWRKRLAEMDEVENLTANAGPLVLSGEIVVELPSGNSSLRQKYETVGFSDFTIKVEDESFQTRKKIIAAKCPAILDLLPHRKADSVTIHSTPEAVKALLQYLHDDPLDFSDLKLVSLCCNVLVLAENFKLLPLKQMCEAALAGQLNSANVFELAGFATSFNSLELKNKAFEFAAKDMDFDTLVVDKNWVSLKTDSASTAMSMCEFIIKSVAQKATVANAERKDDTPECAEVLFNEAHLEIPVRWEIPDFQSLMENRKRGFSVVCKEKFSHESMPGIAWELILYPNGKEDRSHRGYEFQSDSDSQSENSDSEEDEDELEDEETSQSESDSESDTDYVALFMRPLLTSAKKSQATAPNGGFSLRFEPVSNANATGAPPPEKGLPVQQFSLTSERGIARFARQSLVCARSLSANKAALLMGKILIEPPHARPTLVSRKAFESGNRSDFTIKVDGEWFPVHTFILSGSSPVMQAMFDTNCWESENNVLVMKETTVEAVRALLQFWYGDPLCFDGLDELVMDVYKLANRYQDFTLRQICEDALLRMASSENVVHLATFAADQSCESLEKAAAKIILENAYVLEQDAWTQLKDENFKLALMIVEGVIAKHSFNK